MLCITLYPYIIDPFLKLQLLWVDLCNYGDGRCSSNESRCLRLHSESAWWDIGWLHQRNTTLNNQSFPASSLSIFRPGSTSPSAILFDAWESFTSKSPKADESIRSIRPELAKAVDECIEAAGQEWEPYWQRRLLNVSCFHSICFEPLMHPLLRLPNLAAGSLISIIRLISCIWGKHSKCWTQYDFTKSGFHLHIHSER